MTLIDDMNFFVCSDPYCSSPLPPLALVYLELARAFLVYCLPLHALALKPYCRLWLRSLWPIGSTRCGYNSCLNTVPAPFLMALLAYCVEYARLRSRPALTWVKLAVHRRLRL